MGSSKSLYWIDVRNPKNMFQIIHDHPIKSIDYKFGSALISTDVYSYYLPNVDYFNGRCEKLTDYPGIKTFRESKNKKNFKNISLSDDGTIGCIGSDDNNVYLWDVNKNKIIQKVETNDHIVSTHIDGCGTVIVSHDSKLCFYELLKKNEEIEEIEEIEEDIVETEANWETVGLSSKILCTKEEGYIQQNVFVCKTCLDNNHSIGGLCETCSKMCHIGHEIVNIGLKKNFKCDCGTSRFKNYPCKFSDQTIFEDNDKNIYNHNFKQEYCYCNEPYSINDEYVQCYECDDWFHNKCITDDEIPDDLTYLCELCTSKFKGKGNYKLIKFRFFENEKGNLL